MKLRIIVQDRTILEVKTVVSSENFGVFISKCTAPNSEDSSLHEHHCENLKFREESFLDPY